MRRTPLELVVEGARTLRPRSLPSPPCAPALSTSPRIRPAGKRSGSVAEEEDKLVSDDGSECQPRRLTGRALVESDTPVSFRPLRSHSRSTHLASLSRTPSSTAPPTRFDDTGHDTGRVPRLSFCQDALQCRRPRQQGARCPSLVDWRSPCTMRRAIKQSCL